MTRQAVSGTPRAFTWQTTALDTYDPTAGSTDAYDANGNETVTSYTVNSAGLTTGESVARAVDHEPARAHDLVTSQTFDPTRASP